MKFNSQICTSHSQSERLLALGLKKVTADCVVSSIGSKDRLIHTEEPIYVTESLNSKGIPNYPAWSLHRLIEMCAIPKVPFIRVKFQNTYDEIISLIAEMIKFGAFNKEYLEE